MEMLLQGRLHVLLDDRLGNPVRHGRYSERPHPPVPHGYLDPQDGRRKVAARGQPVPELLEVSLLSRRVMHT